MLCYYSVQYILFSHETYLRDWENAFRTNVLTVTKSVPSVLAFRIFLCDLSSALDLCVDGRRSNPDGDGTLLHAVLNMLLYYYYLY
jgi:hypothetical protein